MKVVATIEARMTSTRLPGKVLLPANNKPLLGHLIDRLKKVELIDDIVLATTNNKEDEPLINIAQTYDIKYHCGSEENVMQRVLDSAKSANADIVVEITGDCPIIDPAIVEQCIKMFLNNECEYLTNAHLRSYPDGMDVQVFNTETLEKSASMTNDLLDQEHVTLHIRNHPEAFKAIHLLAPKELHWPELGLTLDEKKDYILLKKIIEHFQANPYFNCYEVIKLLREKPDWVKINNSVKRKGDS